MLGLHCFGFVSIHKLVFLLLVNEIDRDPALHVKQLFGAAECLGT